MKTREPFCEPPESQAIRGRFVAGCARAASGHTVAPPSNVMNPRRLN
jgi:hypothetical protein